MVEYGDEIEALLLKYVNNYVGRDAAVYAKHKDLALYFIRQGFSVYEAQQRRIVRNDIKKNILKPEFQREIKMKSSTSTSPAVKVNVSEKTATKAMGYAAEMFTNWKIGKLEIGDATKARLVIEANNERSRAGGHVINAIIYEKLAEPMNNVETVSEHWKTRKAVELIRGEILRSAEHVRVGFIPVDGHPVP
jgi:hypothetical protein